MESPKENSTRDFNEKSTMGFERSVTPEEDIRAEVLEDDGEVFKANAGQAQFRALGM